MRIRIDLLSRGQRIEGESYQVSIDIGSWNLVREFGRSELIELRDRINQLFGFKEISDLFNIDIPKAEEIKRFHNRNRDQCESCELRLKACRECVLVCQSPLERDLYLALLRNGLNIELQKRINKDGSCHNYTESIDKESILTIPDFYVATDSKKLAIYADGHTYHERTEYQALRDRNIDRELQSLGYMVLRFTGKEIRSDTQTVVDNIRKNL